MKPKTIAALLAGSATLVAADANAASSVAYTDLTSFQAAATVTATKDFNTVPVGTKYKGAEILSGIVAGTNATNLDVNTTSIGHVLFAWDGVTRQNGNLYYEFDLPSVSYNAVAFNVEAWNPNSSASKAVLELADGSTATYSFVKSGGAETDPFFVGFTASSDIRKIFWYEGLETGTSVNEEVAINMFRVGTAPVPEPETYAMMLAGLGLLGWARRKRNSA